MTEIAVDSDLPGKVDAYMRALVELDKFSGSILIANIFIIAVAFLLNKLGALKLMVLVLSLATLLSLIPHLLHREKKRREYKTLPD